MKKIYAGESLDNIEGPCVFLAGPTPRSQDVVSWRPDAVAWFVTTEFSGTLLLPEDRSGVFRHSYENQIEWEERALYAADCIMFWVPRSLPDMPAFTTNDEWGTWKKSGKVTWGSPVDAVKVSYQLYYAKKFAVPIATELHEAVKNSIWLADKKFWKDRE